LYSLPGADCSTEHTGLYKLQVQHNILLITLKCITWYSKIISIINWEGSYSKPCTVTCGVRQGGVLSPKSCEMCISFTGDSQRNLGHMQCWKILTCISWSFHDVK